LAEHGRQVDGWIASGCSAALRLLAIALLLQALNPTPAGVLWHTSLGIELSAWLPVQGLAGLGTYEAGAWLGSTLGGGEPQSFVAAALVAHAFGIVLAVTAVIAAQLATIEAAPVIRPAT
jgi:phage-related tail protein